MQKWMAFFLFVWFFGMIFGATFEGSTLETFRQRGLVATNETAPGATQMTTLNYLFDFKNATKETSVGTITFKVMDPTYIGAWFGILVLDFNFLKEYNSATGNYDETLWSYFFKMIGAMGLLSAILLFIDLLQGFITS